ncbi:putative leydig cell tumor 10 kDa protein-like [Apostichopus japonicus]|uniref:Putative leydig cell tumor 10 kDa protein-like n=1 Tax=Stichopus japonicus TaxID=307972 RepID=A0A2G8KUJ8_STIJA|nr:putative leydig cell tumor 10 kDa protein-like [Apostichopus japonicus]
MAQGKLKTKTSIPDRAKNKKKQKLQQQKRSQLRKGSRFIAPKKAHKLQSAKLKKNLQKTINKCIESEIAARVTSQEGQQLKVVNVPKGSGDKKKK